MGHDDLDPDTKSGSLKETQVLSKLATLETGSVLVGRFKIQSIQGCGRFGCVYKATDLQLDTTVAIKVLHQHLLDSTSLRDFKNEILTLRQLSHPNIVRVHEYYEDSDTHFITMDWIEGQTLNDWLKENSVVALQDIQNFTTQLLSALEVTESKGIRHKDLKPDNILIDHNNQLYIADFGIASAIGDEVSSIISGTPLYSPPEYIESGKESDSIDLYAFGLILYELIIGKPPYEAQTQEELLKEKQQQQKVKLPKTFATYQKVIQQCTAPLPSSRPTDVRGIKNLIGESSNPSNKPPFVSVVSAFALVLAVVIGIYWYTGSDQAENGSQENNDSMIADVANENSLAVLPFETKATASWLVDGLPSLLSDELSQIPELRVVGHERSRNTLDLLGYKQPLDDAKLKVISDLTQSSYLLNTQVTPIGPSKFKVNVKFLQVTGNNVVSTSILEFQSSKDDLAQELSGLAAAVNKQFGLKPIETSTSLPDSIDLQRLSELEVLLQKGEKRRAKAELESLLANAPSYSKGWLQLGQIEAESGDILAAESALQKALETSGENSLVHKKTQAELELIAGDNEAAIATYQGILKQLPNNNEIRFDLAQLYTEQQLLEDAKQALTAIVDKDENHPLAWYELSKVAIWQGNTQEAVDNYLVKALVTAKKLKNVQLEGDVLNAFGVAYHRLGQLEMALDYYQQGLVKREKVNDARGVVTSLSNLASVYAVKGQYQQAEDSLLRALDVNESRNDAIKQADLFNELGVIAEEQGAYTKALEHFRASLSIRMKLDDDWLKAESLNNVAYIFFLLSDEEQATIYWEQAKAYYEKVDDPVGVIRVNENMAQLELQKGNWQEAYQMYQSALEKSEELNLTEETIVAKAYLAKIAFLQGNFEQPILELETIKSELKERQDIRGQVEFGLWIADWSLSTGDYENVRTVLSELEPLVGQENNRSQQFRLDTLTSRLDLYSMSSEENDIKVLDSEAQLKQVTTKAALEHLIHQLETLLLSSSENVDKGSFNQAIQQFEQFDLELHRYYLIRKLILSGYFHAQANDADALKTTLDQLVMLKRGVGTYWRNYQIERLQSIYYGMIKNPEKAEQHALAAVKSFTELKQQLSEQQQQHFISLQGRFFSNDESKLDRFTELINDKE
ncbi:serine/threonine-protein kinase [Kangiella taiwanensis]|uniref:Protein kinase domain-containing protein n=1 Tax=Kangiella taiwanensis TaxID=1079179 RepID=A0ABP8I819_9GAMM|nr:serine/threonine-protein kinase [Kangiella taiwanensis]